MTMTLAEQLIRRAEKAIQIAEPHVATALRRAIADLKINPENTDAQFRIRSWSNAAYTHARVKQFGLD